MDSDVTTDKTGVLARACAALSSADPALAGQVLRAGYPFVAARKVARRYTERQMLRDSAKAHWTMHELGWSMVPGGDLSEWDGLSAWYVEYLTERSYLLDDQPYLQRWFSATVDIRAEG